MRVSATILALATTLALGSAAKINMSCKFASDHTGMVQTPYCCRGLKANENNPKINEATDCKALSQPQLCEDQSRPACCYEIGPKKICTSHVLFQDAKDI
ncbi:hypothetical protein N7509_010997 [Penicillium cosmopolitanum]|uniref:Hydrophobin n=1 Tax=Penicillium cosmopolitanum TaxID=1131564 RepID=A0A9W9VSD6_9EURO|nr:uncharacterized protein N7509_010997 [Penicillium cosmopolitanum]KAJ5388456.1 hypothetical protein N7509_010997 [Penicillium cosmopolitanum]